MGDAVDLPGQAPGALEQGLDGRRLEQRQLASREPEAVLDVGLDLIAVETGQMVADDEALAEGFVHGHGQAPPELGQADEDEAQALLRIHGEVREQAQVLEDVVAQVMGLVDDQHRQLLGFGDETGDLVADCLVRYERLKDIVTLAIRMQGLHGGMTVDEIRAEFRVSRRTAERMRDAVEWAFGPLETVERNDNKNHWRMRSDALRRLVPLSAEELGELGSAAETLARTGFEARAAVLRELDTKLRATLRTDSLERIEADIEALVQAEGLAMRPGPRPQLDRHLLALLREAIITRRVVALRYLARTTGRHSWQRIEPYGLLYGNRSFLVGRTDWKNKTMRLWRLSNMSEARVTSESFARDTGFDLEAYARRSFGTFQEEPVDVVLRFTPEAKRDASAFLFHPSQAMEENADGTLTVRFTAGGIDEMCWHLITWGESVTVEHPAHLRQRLAEMCAGTAAHHLHAVALP